MVYTSYCLQDPVRSFVGREKYNRPLWAIDALENPSVVRACNAISFYLYHVLRYFIYYFKKVRKLIYIQKEVP